MPLLSFGGNKNKFCNLSDMIFFMKNMKIGTRIRIHFGPGFTFSKCGSEDPDSLLRKGGSEDPDPLFLRPKCGSQDPDPDPRQNKMDPKRCNIYI